MAGDSGVYSREEGVVRGEVSALLTNDKETFTRFELELESLLRGSEAQAAGALADDKLKQVLEKEIAEHKRLMEESEGLVWRPVEIATPQKNLRHRFFKNDFAPVNSGHFAEEYHMPETRSARAKASSFIEAGRHHDWTTNTSCRSVSLSPSLPLSLSLSLPLSLSLSPSLSLSLARSLSEEC